MIKITNPDKIIDSNITKLDVVNYYNKISKYILKYIKDFPISEIRCHNGLECFFKKHPNNNTTDLIYVSSVNDLLSDVQNGTIEFHTYSNKKNSNMPLIMVFDLDPDENLPLKKLREGVLNLKQILDKLNLVSFLKTSGGKGYHVVVPFKKTKGFYKFEKFAYTVACLMEKTWPNLYTTNIRIVERKGRIFVDYLRNKLGATCVAPYSLRARKNLPISFPISWEDLYKISPNKINIKNVDNYLISNPWENFFKLKQELN